MKLWGGRFSASTDSFTDHFHSSISFDKRLYREDIEGSIAHVKGLSKQGIIAEDESALIEKTLLEILNEIENGKILFDEKAEDIHMNIETLLINKIGSVGKKLHTGRSRNDQVATDLRLYTLKAIKNIKFELAEFLNVITNIAKNHTETIMPGYTHLQKAQPITLAHHLLAYGEMFKRDISRLDDCYKRTNVSPLGSGALATTTYNLDREFVAELLGFGGVSLNSLDGVSDRDFCIELISNISTIMMHLSRFSEEVILWSSHEFRFIELDDSYATGSSIMPQKKNPDMAELIRGKTGRVYGDLVSILTVMKGLPLAYNKDMQEDKESVFDAIDTVLMCIPIFKNMIDTMKVNKNNMLNGAKGGFTNATDAADYLTKKGIPFRDSHEILGKLVLYCINNNKSLDELELSEYKNCSEVFEEDVYEAISLKTCVNKRNIIGGPAKESMEKLISINEDFIVNIDKE